MTESEPIVRTLQQDLRFEGHASPISAVVAEHRSYFDVSLTQRGLPLEWRLQIPTASGSRSSGSRTEDETSDDTPELYTVCDGIQLVTSRRGDSSVVDFYYGTVKFSCRMRWNSNNGSSTASSTQVGAGLEQEDSSIGTSIPFTYPLASSSNSRWRAAGLVIESAKATPISARLYRSPSPTAQHHNETATETATATEQQQQQQQQQIPLTLPSVDTIHSFSEQLSTLTDWFVRNLEQVQQTLSRLQSVDRQHDDSLRLLKEDEIVQVQHLLQLQNRVEALELQAAELQQTVGAVKQLSEGKLQQLEGTVAKCVQQDASQRTEMMEMKQQMTEMRDAMRQQYSFYSRELGVYQKSVRDSLKLMEAQGQLSANASAQLEQYQGDHDLLMKELASLRREQDSQNTETVRLRSRVTDLVTQFDDMKLFKEKALPWLRQKYEQATEDALYQQAVARDEARRNQWYREFVPNEDEQEAAGNLETLETWLKA